MSDVTRILVAIERGDGAAAKDLLPVVYEELRRLAAQRIAHESPGLTLQPTALVHEAYLRLVDGGQELRWQGRGHFFAAAAEAMRRILVDDARRRRAEKRGGRLARQPLDERAVADDELSADVLAVNDALEKLARTDPDAARLVHLKYFAGLTIPDAAQVLDVSPRTADRLWAYARAWLHRELVTE